MKTKDRNIRKNYKSGTMEDNTKKLCYIEESHWKLLLLKQNTVSTKILFPCILFVNENLEI